MKERRDNESNRVMMKNAIKALFSSSSTVSSIMHHIADTKVISSQQISSILFRANLFFSNTSWCQAKTMNLFSFLFATASIFLISTVFFPCFINFFLLFVNSYKEEKFILKKKRGFFRHLSNAVLVFTVPHSHALVIFLCFYKEKEKISISLSDTNFRLLFTCRG